MAPQYDIIVHGATGFTGRLVCRMLLQDADNLKWAIAGRNEKKLQETKSLLKKFPDLDSAAIDAVPVVIADSMNEAQIVSMVQQTKVVLSLVGPYKRYGEALVKACAENGVHYCDLTGEIIWVREMINKYEAAAQKSGAKILHCCGQDCIPSDLTAFLLADTVRKTHKSKTSKVNMFFTEFVGGIGGGTIATMITQQETSTPAEIRSLDDPFVLTDAKTKADKELRCVVAPNTDAAGLMLTPEVEINNKYSSRFVMVRTDQSIVHRTNYLLNDLYGESFVFRERNASQDFFKLLIGTIMGFLVRLMFAFGPTRAILAKRVTQPGDGPSEEVMQNGKIRVDAFAYDENNKLAARLRVTGAGDPGLLLTAKMIAESAKGLALGETSEIAANKGGFWTPASAFGHKLRERLEKKNVLKFEVQDL